MNEVDFERAAMLLDVIAKGSADPVAANIVGEAREELREINEVARENAIERANERAAEEAKRQQAAALALKGEKPELEQIEESAEDEDDEPAPTGRRA